MKYFEDNLYIFSINGLDETQKRVDELNARIKSIGGKAEIVESNGCEYLAISFSEDYYKKVTRNAGKKLKYRSNMITYGDIRRWQSKKVTSEEIAKRLGCSRATFYRRMKEAKEMGYPDSEAYY